MHVQWTGSNSHNNGNPGGDGQTGDAGQGNGGTDRNNLVQINNLNENLGLPFEISSIWSDAELIGFLNSPAVNFTDDTSQYLVTKGGFQTQNLAKDLALYFASSAYYKCVQASTCGSQSYESLSAKGSLLDADLNTSPASVGGAILRFQKPNSVYYYMCSRNNNFSNRNQKGTLTVQ